MTIANRESLLKDLRALGLCAGDVLLVHTSFRALGPVEGGAFTLLRALDDALGDEGTLVMPTMTDGASPFDPASTPSYGMGITAELFWREPGVVRSTHPGASFAARGPLAARICAPHPLEPPHGIDSPVGRVFELDGRILLLGVEHSENTTLHLAESLARVPYSISHPCVVVEHGVVREVWIAETDHCCRGFCQLDAWLRPSGRSLEGKVAAAHARLVRAADVVAVACAKLAEEPLVFLCSPDRGCDECAAARASVAAAP